jgi:heat shock protein HtpX
MKIAKRIFLFLIVNILIVATLSIALNIFGIKPYLSSSGIINYYSLMMFCLVWGFGGAFISLALSRMMAKWAMGVRLINETAADSTLRDLYFEVESLAKKAEIPMPQVGIYESEEINAFATGPTKNRSLVAVSSGLLNKMNKSQLRGVLAHEVAHISNGDMVTMTLLQGVVNAIVMFVARVIGFFASQAVEEEKRSWVQFIIVFICEIALGMLGMLVVAAFSRAREFRADKGGATYSSRNDMISALKKLQETIEIQEENPQSSLATLKISQKPNSFLSLFSTHPDLEERIANLEKMG